MPHIDRYSKADSSSNDLGLNQPIPKTVWVLGIMVFFINLSFVMTFSYIGVYLKNVLCVSMTSIGLLEGVAEGASFAMKFFAGVFSDHLKRRKPVMICGYIMLASSRLIMPIASCLSHVFAARVLERIGNGIQGAPRDAMVADVSPTKRIGASYGVKRTLGQFGSMIGAFAGIAVMYFSNDNYVANFWVATIPAAFAIFILIFFVKESKKFDHLAVSSEIPLPVPKRRYAMNLSKLTLLGKTFWILMLVNGFFMLSRFGETFLIIHATNNLGLAARYAPLVMIFFNTAWCMSSYPAGALSDRFNRYIFLGLGIICLVLADLFFIMANSLTTFWVGVFFWGVQYGVTQNAFTSLIAEKVPENLRGTGFGCYYIINAIAAFIAEFSTGVICQNFGQHYAFMASSIVALVSLVFLMMVMELGTSRS